MKSLIAFGFLVLSTIASFGLSVPELKIQDAIATPDAYLVRTKYIPEAFYVSSAIFTTETDGTKTWRVQYDPVKAMPIKDAWFIVVVEMDKTCYIIQEK
jgi:hypothetical protein